MVQEGKIVESGSHEKLMKQGGAYFQLNSQQSWFFIIAVKYIDSFLVQISYFSYENLYSTIVVGY